MNYLSEPRGAAVPFGMYQDLGATMAERKEKAWRLYTAKKFDELVAFIAKFKKKSIRNELFAHLLKKGVSTSDLAALKNAVNAARSAQQPAAAAAGPNYLLWGGVALAVAAGGYFLFFRKKKGKRS